MFATGKNPVQVPLEKPLPMTAKEMGDFHIFQGMWSKNY